MGNWNLTIRGTGPHHNHKPDTDIDLMVQDFLYKLKKAGHTFDSKDVSLTVGTSEHIHHIGWLPDPLQAND